jgi:hypothetical protein
VTRQIYRFGITIFFFTSLRSCYSYVTFFNYLSLRRPLSNKKRVRLIMLSIVSLMPLIAPSAILPCLTATFKVFLRFGALGERYYHEIIWLQDLNTLREERNAVRELRRCDERVYMFRCLVIHISLDRIYYVHTRGSLYFAARIRRLSHVCGMKYSRVWRRSGRSNFEHYESKSIFNLSPQATCAASSQFEPQPYK